MTPYNPERRADRAKPHKISGKWKQIERTAPQPGEWVQTRDGWERAQ